MTILPNIDLRADFPDDGVEDGHDIVVFPGRNIAEALKIALEPLGYQVSEPIHAHEHGWELEIYRGRKRLWMQITNFVADHECFIMTKNMTSWFWPDVDLHRAFLADLQRVLEADPRFSEMVWRPKDY